MEKGFPQTHHLPDGTRIHLEQKRKNRSFALYVISDASSSTTTMNGLPNKIAYTKEYFERIACSTPTKTRTPAFKAPSRSVIRHLIALAGSLVLLF